jgi:hypothetical protein
VTALSSIMKILIREFAVKWKTSKTSGIKHWNCSNSANTLYQNMHIFLFFLAAEISGAKRTESLIFFLSGTIEIHTAIIILMLSLQIAGAATTQISGRKGEKIKVATICHRFLLTPGKIFFRKKV